GRNFASAEDLPETKPDQIGGAGIFDDAEGQRGGGEQRREAERGRGDMDECGRVDTQYRDEAGAAALLDRAGEDVEHGWARHDQQHQGGADEQPQVGGAGRYDFHAESPSSTALGASSAQPGLSVNDGTASHPIVRPAIRSADGVSVKACVSD